MLRRNTECVFLTGEDDDDDDNVDQVESMCRTYYTIYATIHHLLRSIWIHLRVELQSNGRPNDLCVESKFTNSKQIFEVI